MPRADSGHVAVVGAGWAGIAAAVTLVGAGRRVTICDAAAEPGGRARTLEVVLCGERVALDNGQHLLIGAYRRTLALLDRMGIAEASVLARSPLRLEGTDGLRIAAPRLPAPLHLAAALLGARGLAWSERLALGAALRRLAGAGWRPPAGVATVGQWLAAERQPPRLARRIWEPLCVAALNTPAAQACATTFCAVLRDSLGATRSASDFLLPRATLGDVLPVPAIAWLRANGARVLMRTPCRGVQAAGDGWRLSAGEATIAADRVILAVPPSNVARLFDPPLPPPLAATLDGFGYESIATAWLAWDAPVALPAVALLRDDAARGRYGQWLFDRGEHVGGRRLRLAGVVVSASGRSAPLPAPRLAAAIAAQVAEELGCPGPCDARVIVDKRATIACTPTRPRVDPLAIDAARPGIVLAGDWTDPEYPATLEAAVRSGELAARLAIAGR